MGLKDTLNKFEKYEVNVSRTVVPSLNNIISFLEKKHGLAKKVAFSSIEERAALTIPRFINNHLDITVKELQLVILLFNYEYEGMRLSDEFNNLKKIKGRIDLVNSEKRKQKTIYRFFKLLNENYGKNTSLIEDLIQELLPMVSSGYRKGKCFIETYKEFPIYDGGTEKLGIELFDRKLRGMPEREILRSLFIPTSDNENNILNLILKKYLELCSNFITEGKGPKPVYDAFLIPGADSEIQFKSLTGEIVNSLLYPFSNHFENKELRKKIIEFIDKNVGDPRFKPAEWVKVQDNLKDLYLGWKTRVSMEVFFNVISDSAGETDKGREHWEERRKYWTWFLEQELITEAWVILGSKAERLAKGKFPESATIQYGIGNLRESSKSHIMMRIKNLIIVECSHNGMIWFFRADSKKKINFYKKSYDKYEFDSGKLDSKTHVPGKWPLEVDDTISKVTKINIRKLRRGY